MTTAEQRFEELFAAHYGDVLAYCVRRSVSAQDAEDVVAETFAVAWRRINEVPIGEHARLWLFGTARLVRFNQRRALSRQQGLITRLQMRRPAGPSTGVDDDLVERDRIQRAFSTLQGTDREILQLHVWEQLSTDQIATVLEISAPVVWKRLQRARERLAAALAASADDEVPEQRSAAFLAPPVRKAAR